MRSYETAIIWSASVPEADLETELTSVLEVIGGAEGTLEGTDKWGRRMLAYPISKQTEGVYHFIRWTGDPAVIPAIDKHLRIRECCLRHLTLRSDGHPADPAGMSGRPRGSSDTTWSDMDENDDDDVDNDVEDGE